jgi:hypothetical protein
MKYINFLKSQNDDFLLMRYLGLDVTEIKKLDPIDRNIYLDAIRTNLSKGRASRRCIKIKNLF